VSILVVGSSLAAASMTNFQKALQPITGDHGLSCAGFEDAGKVYAQERARLVFVLCSQDADRALAVLRDLRPQVDGHIIAVGQASEPQAILQALRSGADHYLDEADVESELDAVRARFLTTTARNGRVAPLLAVLSSSGGCGASTLAVNIAAVLAADKAECVLIDLHPARGDLAALLDVKPAFTLVDLCRNEKRLDRSVFDRTLTRHASGIRLLAAPFHHGDAGLVTEQGVSQALTMARRWFSHVVVDLEDYFHNEQILTLQQATGILLICRLDFTALRNAAHLLEQLNKLDIPADRIRVVLNRYDEANELPVEEAEHALGKKLALFVPNDPKTIAAANNAGTPAVLKFPNTKVAQCLSRLAKIDFESSTGAVSFWSRALSAASSELKKRSRIA
jgi:pilus assembly protein CpaE